MKKIVSILLVMIFLTGNISFGQGDATCQCTNGVVSTCPNIGGNQLVPGSSCTCKFGNDILSCTETSPTTQDCASPCTGGKLCSCTPTGCSCTTPTTNSTTPAGGSSTSVMGITCNQNQLINGQCKLNIYDTLGIRKSVRDTGQATSVGLFVQDVVLSATMFIGTLVTIALIVSGIMYIFAASSGKDPAKAKQGIIGSLVGLLIVVSSYVIIRLVQYIAKGF